MIIRKWDNSLVVLESTTDGVTVYKYDGRLSSRTRFAFAIRRLLRVERTAALRKTVWDFVTSVRGKPYESQTLQMVRPVSLVSPAQPPHSLIETFVHSADTAADQLSVQDELKGGSLHHLLLRTRCRRLSSRTLPIARFDLTFRLPSDRNP